MQCVYISDYFYKFEYLKLKPEITCVMKMIRTIYFISILSVLTSCSNKQSDDNLQKVNLLIGTGAATTPSAKGRTGDHVDYGQTIPAVTAPFGMTQWTPQTFASEKKCLSPFYWGNLTLQGFRATHWTSGSCVQDYGSFTVFPTTFGDQFQFMPSQRNTQYIFDA